MRFFLQPKILTGLKFIQLSSIIIVNDLTDGGNTYDDYINQFKSSLIRDIMESYPDLKREGAMSLPKLLSATGDKFIFIIDEWDYIFSHGLYPENQSDFLEFLRDLLKDKTYVTLAYMTGVLPIQKYSTPPCI